MTHLVALMLERDPRRRATARAMLAQPSLACMLAAGAAAGGSMAGITDSIKQVRGRPAPVPLTRVRRCIPYQHPDGTLPSATR